jgi:hypothetical protein
MSEWTYTGGELCAVSATRTYKSRCERYGKVSRSRGSPELGYGKATIKYFIRRAPMAEYTSLEAAIEADHE